MNAPRQKATELAEGHWSNILQAAGIDSSLLTSQETPCPICGGSTRFRYYDKTEKGPKEHRQNRHGLSFCNHCRGRNGIQLLMEYKGIDFKDACKFIESWYYGNPVEARKPIPQPVLITPAIAEQELVKKKAKQLKVWNGGVAVTVGDPVWKYLCMRIPGFHEGMLSPMIRFHPKLEYWVPDGPNKYKLLGTYPAMIAYITAPDGTRQDIHQTFLTPDGFKADVPIQKKTVRSIEVFGGAIQLSQPMGNVLAVSEGIETAYAVELFKNLPSWSLLNTHNMSVFEVPSQIKFLHIFMDNDKPDCRGVRVGLKAGLALKKRAEEKGVIVKLHTTTTPGTDILDLLVKIHSASPVAA